MDNSHSTRRKSTFQGMYHGMYHGNKVHIYELSLSSLSCHQYLHGLKFYSERTRLSVISLSAPLSLSICFSQLKLFDFIESVASEFKAL